MIKRNTTQDIYLTQVICNRITSHVAGLSGDKYTMIPQLVNEEVRMIL